MDPKFILPAHIYAQKGTFKHAKNRESAKSKQKQVTDYQRDDVIMRVLPKRGAQGPQKPPMFGKRSPGFSPRQYWILTELFDKSHSCGNMPKDQFLRLFHLVFARRLLVIKSTNSMELIQPREILDAFSIAERRGFYFMSVDFKNPHHGSVENILRIREIFTPDGKESIEKPVAFTLRKTEFRNIHKVTPEENGSHGEVTGWDDLDMSGRYPICGKIDCTTCPHECFVCEDEFESCLACQRYSFLKHHTGGRCTASRNGLSSRLPICGVLTCLGCSLRCIHCSLFRCAICSRHTLKQSGLCTAGDGWGVDIEPSWETIANTAVPGWTVLPEQIIGNPLVQSSLNGSHGEYTESDDVENIDNLLLQMADAAEFDNRPGGGRLHREALNRQQRRPLANREMAPRIRRPRGPPPNQREVVANIPPPEIIDDPLVTSYVTPDPELLPLYYYEETRRYVTHPPGPVVPEGVVMRCVKNKPGCIVVKGDHGADLMTRACVSIVNIPTYEFGGKCYPAYTAPILVLLATELRKSHGPMVPSEQSLRTITASAVKHIAESSMEGLHLLVRNTIEYFVMAAQWGLASGRTQRVAFFMPHLDFSRVDIRRDNLWARGIYRMEHVECDPMDYDIRSDMVVRVLRGDVHIEPTGHPVFPRNNKASYNTVFCRISGANQLFFRTYSADDCNIRSAGKRVLGKREGEEQLRYNSRITYRSLINAFSGRQVSILPIPKLSKSLTSSVTYMHNMYPHLIVIPANGDDPLPVEPFELLDSVKCLLSRLIVRLLSRCDGDYLDFMSVLARSAYYNIIIGKERLLEPIYSRSSCSQIPHAKKQLRISIVNKQQFAGVASQLAKPEAKIKKDELAKPGKAARLFVTYGDGVMQQNEIPEIVKVVLHGMHESRLSYRDDDVYCRIFVFSKPAPGDMDDMLEMICDNLTVANFMIGLVFSDDGCLIASKDGVPVMCNVDISSNDAGKDMMQFGMIHALTTAIHAESADVLMDAFKLPITVSSSTRGGPSISISGAPFMGSGHTYTTIMNHCDSLAIQTAAFGYFFSTPHMTLPQAIELAGAAVGQILTCDECSSLEQLQFIKHSPTQLLGGQYAFLPNVSAFMKSFISVRGDLEAKHLGLSVLQFRSLTDAQRFDMLGYQRVQSWCHYPSGRIIDAFRTRFPPVKVSALDVVEHVPLTDNSVFRLDESSFNKRYDLSEYEVDSLVADILSLAVGDELTSVAVAKIYAVDYALPIQA